MFTKNLLFMNLLLAMGCSADVDKPIPIIINTNDSEEVGSVDLGSPDIADVGADVAEAQTEFALRVSVSIIGWNQQEQIAIAVRDAATSEVVFFEQSEEMGEVAFEALGLLEAGKSYRVGVTTKYAECLSEYEDSFFAEINEVSKDIELRFEGAPGEERINDFRACEVLHQPVQMPAGRYRQPEGTLPPGQNVSVVVSETGRLYLSSAYVTCDGGEMCSSSLVTAGFGVCRPTSADTPLPGEDSFRAVASNEPQYNEDQSKFEATIVIDEDADVFHVTGEARTTFGRGGGECCSKVVEFDLVKVSDETSDCP